MAITFEFLRKIRIVTDKTKKAASFYRDGFSDIWNKFVII